MRQGLTAIVVMMIVGVMVIMAVMMSMMMAPAREQQRAHHVYGQADHRDERRLTEGHRLRVQKPDDRLERDAHRHDA